MSTHRARRPRNLIAGAGEASMMAAQFLQKLKDNPPQATPAGSLAD